MGQSTERGLADALELLRFVRKAMGEVPDREMVSWVKCLRDQGRVDDALLVAAVLPAEALGELVPDLVNLAAIYEWHESACELLARLPFDSGAELIVPEVLRLLTLSTDYWVVWLEARLLHWLGYHEALRHVVKITRDTQDSDWRMVGDWIVKDLLRQASSEASRP